MLSIDECLKILNKNTHGKKYTKEEAKEKLTQLCQLAQIEFQNYKIENNESRNLPKSIN
jgi:hypothetical protein